ncbi:phosphoglycerate dehydrogenase, partial [Rhodococcus erythropolis]|nr:phosphoglycerate dehydrogenase [Rhodococcus erythropolis]
LGNAGVDILAAALSQDAEGEGATVILRVDRVVGDAEVEAIVSQLDARVAQVDLS